MLPSRPLALIEELLRHLARGGERRPLAYSRLLASLQMVIHFYFDLAASLGAHMGRKVVVERAELAIHGAVPEYRASIKPENLPRLTWIGVSVTSADLVHTLKVRSKSVVGGSQLSSGDIRVIYMVWSVWEMSVSSAGGSDCPQLDGVLRCSLTLLALRLLDECRDVVSLSEGRRIRDFITNSNHDGIEFPACYQIFL